MARPTSPVCAPWRSTPYAWPVTRTSPPACDNTRERPSCRWPPSGSYDDFAGALGRCRAPTPAGPEWGADGPAVVVAVNGYSFDFGGARGLRSAVAVG